ncbi:hypothetical protein LTR84_001683 [Exophiala bonariae]|uniref:Xylanolytic transcriptional activator regulatory domain-containing protein n=1 Tax=Exophiala bonariae TaxID=1690606 RepID=A0AAV9NFQ7_9EURO|nr:hypothetical protein LTR84_001683 [Exophiala bonariae]
MKRSGHLGSTDPPNCMRSDPQIRPVFSVQDEVQIPDHLDIGDQPAKPQISKAFKHTLLLPRNDPRPLRSLDHAVGSGSIPLGQTLSDGNTCAADNEFQGPASTTAFMLSIRRIIEGGPPVDDVSMAQRNSTSSHNPVNASHHLLPVRQLADTLVANYWEFVHPLYPFLHGPDFDIIYDCLWTGKEHPTTACTVMRVDPTTSLCVLNLIFALGCQYHRDIDAEIPATSTEIFYQRARSLFRVNPIESGQTTLQLVQAMLLMTQVLVSTGHNQKAWGVIGMAVRSCYQLGLHHVAGSATNIFPKLEDRETARVVYHGALTLERYE